MKLWRGYLMIGIVFMFLFGATFLKGEHYDHSCTTREIIEATGLSFKQTMLTLEDAVIEGADKIQALREPELQAKALLKVDASQYAIDDSGIFQNQYTKDGSTGFATGFVPFDDELKNNMMALESLDEYFQSMMSQFPFITQVYYNDVQSFSHVYPAFLTEGLVTPGTDLTAYNFVDIAYRNGTGIQFINTPYIDPAGRGWVVSLLKPVEYEGELIGVFGVDLSVTMLKELLIIKNGMLIVNEHGEVMALSEDMYQQAGIKVLKEHRYYSGVSKTILLPDDYNLNKSKILGFRQMWSDIIDGDRKNGSIDFDGKERHYCAIEIENYGIYLIHINGD